MGGQTYKNLSTSYAIKLKHSLKHSGNVVTAQQVKWQQILSWGVCFQSWSSQSSAQLRQMSSLTNLAGTKKKTKKKKRFSWKPLKITSMFHHRGLQLGIDVAVLSLQNITEKWFRHQSRSEISQKAFQIQWRDRQDLTGSENYLSVLPAVHFTLKLSGPKLLRNCNYSSYAHLLLRKMENATGHGQFVHQFFHVCASCSKLNRVKCFLSEISGQRVRQERGRKRCV